MQYTDITFLGIFAVVVGIIGLAASCWFRQHTAAVEYKLKILGDKKTVSSPNDSNNIYSSDSRLDERLVEAGDIEIVATSIDEQSQKFYQDLSEKTKQNDDFELLLKFERENQQQKHIDMHQENHNQAQKKEADKKQNNNKQLSKLRGTKVKKKVAKKIEKVAETGKELTDEDIKKIKINSSSGKLK